MNPKNNAQGIANSIPLPPGVEAVQIGLKINGVWHWNRMGAPEPAPAMQARQPGRPAPRGGNRHPDQERSKAPPMTMGRDPGAFLITFGKFRGKTVEQAFYQDAYDLASWHEHWVKVLARQKRGQLNEGEEPLSAMLEVAVEMVGAFLDAHERPAAAQIGRPR